MKKIYAILGFGLATGVVTYTILNAFRNSKKEQRRRFAACAAFLFKVISAAPPVPRWF